MARGLLAAVGRLARRFWLVPAILALLGAAGALAGPPLWAWYHLAAGRAAVDKFHPDDTRPHLEACLAAWPDCLEARRLAARAARLAGDFAAAEAHLRACQRLENPPSDDTVREWAMFHAAAGDLDDVEAFLLDDIRKNPDQSAPAREALATGYLRTYRVRDERNLLDEWLDARPNEVEALALRADLHWEIGAVGNTTDDYRRVVELDPERREARERLAVGLIENGRYEEALKHLEAVRQWKPDDPKVETRVARCYEWLNRPDEARRTLDAVLARRPDFGPALLQRGQLLLQAGQPAEAEDWLRRAVRAMPNDYTANWALYDALEKEGKAGEAEAQHKRADELHDLDERLTEIRTRQMSLRPRDPALHCELGQVFLKKGSKEQGEHWLLSALRLDPKFRPSHEALARFYEEEGDGLKADEHRRAAQADSSPSPPPKGNE